MSVERQVYLLHFVSKLIHLPSFDSRQLWTGKHGLQASSDPSELLLMQCFCLVKFIASFLSCWLMNMILQESGLLGSLRLAF